MQEIEVKAKLRNKVEIVEKLQGLGCVFSPPVSQDDTVYVENVGSLAIFLANALFARIRVQNSTETIFTIKKSKGALVAVEHEVKVDSKSELQSILELLGYKEAMRVQKVRIMTPYRDWEICIDEVEGLGTYIEVEKLSSDGNAEAIQDELFSFLRTLGISDSDRVTKGYDILMLEKDTI